MRQVLSTLNFKRVRHVGFWLLGTALMLTGGIRLLNYMYNEVGEWSRSVWHYFYEQKSVDMVFIGSSHVFSAVEPEIIDDLSGRNSFNLSFSDQRLEGTYYSLKEALRCYHPQSVAIDLYYLVSTGDGGDYSSDNVITRTWTNTDDMSKLSPVRYEAIAAMNDSEHLLPAFLPFVRYRNYIFDWEHIKKQVNRKRSDAFKSYDYHEDFADGNGSVDYTPKGYYSSSRVMDPQALYSSDRIAEEMTITADAKKYLVKCIELCREEEVKLTLFITPIWAVQLMSTGDYDVYVDSIREIADEYEVPFYDFNLCRTEYLNLESPEYFQDPGHLNKSGADRFTPFFYEVLEGSEEDNAEYFYGSYKERTEETRATVYGAYLRSEPAEARKRAELAEENGRSDLLEMIRDGFLADNSGSETYGGRRLLCIAAGGKEGDVTYRIVLRETADGDEKKPKRVYSEETTDPVVVLPEGESGTCTVEWKTKLDRGTMVFHY